MATSRATPRKKAAADATKEAAAAWAAPGAIGAYGGFFIPKSYGTSIALTGGVEAALICVYCVLSELPADHRLVLRPQRTPRCRC